MHRSHKLGSVGVAGAVHHHQAHHHPLHRHRRKLAKLKPRRPEQPKKLAFAMALILGLGVTAGVVNTNGQPETPNRIIEKPQIVSIPAVNNLAAKPEAQAPVKAAKPKARTAGIAAAIQQTPQLPVNNGAQPYVGSLPDTIPIYSGGPFSFYYAGARQFATATGVSANLTQMQPTVPSQPEAENHSLMELAVLSSDGKQIVEVGWVVDKTMNGDELPHLFVYHWVNGQTSCYNACGFVQASTSVFPGQSVAVGSTGTYSIQYANNAWNILYNGNNVGNFPGSIWGNTFTSFGFVEAFGEVALSTSAATECIQMGNGLAGPNPGSAKVSNFKLSGSNVPEALSPYYTSPSTYSYGAASATGVSIGGPGAC
jgi:hypothetical protein